MHDRTWIIWERRNVARDIDAAERRGASAEEILRLREYALGLWRELVRSSS